MCGEGAGADGQCSHCHELSESLVSQTAPALTQTSHQGICTALTQSVTVHGWCYGLKDGLVNDLGVSMQNSAEVVNVFRNAFKRYPRGETI